MALSKTEKSSRNKTLDISVEEGACFFKRCILDEGCSSCDGGDRSLNGDSPQSTGTALVNGDSPRSAGTALVNGDSPRSAGTALVNGDSPRQQGQPSSAATTGTALPVTNTTQNHTYALKEITDRTICGDTLSVMERLPKGFVDLAVIDPPYNLSKNYAGKKFNAKSQKEYYEYTSAWLEKLLPLLKDNGSFYICCDWKSSMIIADVLVSFEEEEKLFIQNRITWQREKGRGASHNWKNSMEDIWFCTKSQDFTFNLDAVKQRRRVIAPYKVDGKPKDWNETEGGNFRDTCPGNFWDDISIPFWSMAENTAHPTQKPEKLIAKLILASSNEGDFIFDPFLGSGTTSVTAKKLNRHWCGVEQSQQYCTWAEKRLEDADQDTEIQGFKDGVFWERNSL